MNDLLINSIETILEIDGAGRIARERDPHNPVGPRMYMAGSLDSNLVRLRSDVRNEAATEILKLASEEPPLNGPLSRPVHTDRYVEMLGGGMPVCGVSYYFSENTQTVVNASAVLSGTADGDELVVSLDPMPENLVSLGFRNTADFWPPWAAVVHDGMLASICFTARLGPGGAEAGVVTAPGMRGRGLAFQAVSGWASHPALSGRTIFYSAEQSNRSSQRVAEKLGLTFIGATLRIK